jgi:hypothetical protein
VSGRWRCFRGLLVLRFPFLRWFTGGTRLVIGGRGVLWLRFRAERFFWLGGLC